MRLQDEELTHFDFNFSLQTCAPLVLGCLGFVIIACWLGTNMNRFKAEGGWIDCRPTPYV